MSDASAIREDGISDPSRFSRKPRESRADNEIRFTRCGCSAMARVLMQNDYEATALKVAVA
jgi:hypothetical protein